MSFTPSTKRSLSFEIPIILAMAMLTGGAILLVSCNDDSNKSKTTTTKTTQTPEGTKQTTETTEKSVEVQRK